MRALWYSSLQGDAVMKRTVRFIICLIPAILLTLGLSDVPVRAFDQFDEDDGILFEDRDPGEYEDESYFEVTDFGANGSDTEDDRAAINKALSLAATRDDTVTIHVPDGNYYLSGSLFIFSNTILRLSENAVIQALPDCSQKAMIMGSHLDGDGNKCKCSADNTQGICSGYGYSKCSNITVDGGKWVSYTSSDTGEWYGNTVLAIRHAHDITLKNMTCCNTMGHAVNLSGVDTALVSNLTFDTALPKPGKEESSLYVNEFIHLDYCTEDGEPGAYPYDNTPAKNITIENCSFFNGYAGVGNHHLLPDNGEISSAITVRGCTFTNMESYAVGESSVNGLTVENCSATNCMIFAYTRCSSNVMLEGNTFDAVGPHKLEASYNNRAGIHIASVNTAAIRNNTVTNTTNSGISVTSSTDVSIIGNKCTKAGKDGITVKTVSGGVISLNTVSDVEQYGIAYRSATGMTLTGNTLSSKNSGLYIRGNQEDGVSKCVVTDNTFNSKEEYDLYLGVYSNDCYFSGNRFVNYTMLKLADSYTGSVDLPVISVIGIEKASYIYSGASFKPAVIVTDSIGRRLQEGVDYSISYENNTNAGTAQVVVKGKPRSSFFDQEKRADFYIAPKAIEPRVELSTTKYGFANKIRRPGVKVYDGTHLLSKDQYNVTYSKGRKYVGTYKVKVTLRKNYSGTAKASFKIVKGSQKISVKILKKVTKVKYNSDKDRYIRVSKLFNIKNTHGKRAYKLVSGDKKYFVIDRKTGKITVKAHTPRGEYKLKIRIKAAGNRLYRPKSVTKTIRIRVVD